MSAFEILTWISFGLILGMFESYLNLWRGPGWRVAGIGMLGGILGGFLFALMPGAYLMIGDYEVFALLGALVGTLTALSLAYRVSDRSRPIA